MIYLDNSATTQPCPACVRAMTEALTDCWGNPSSVYALGIDAAHRLRQARQAVAAALGARPGVFHLRRHRGRQLGHPFSR